MPKTNIGDIVTLGNTHPANGLHGARAKILNTTFDYAYILILEGGHKGAKTNIDWEHIPGGKYDDSDEITEMPVFYNILDKVYGNKHACIMRYNNKTYCFIQTEEKVKDKTVTKISLRDSSQYSRREKITLPPPWIKIKIKSCDKSSELFPGNRKLRESLIGKSFQVFDYVEQYLCRIDDIKRNCYIIKVDDEGNPKLHGKVLKFLTNEVELQYPNPKGYNIKKDRVIKVGSMVKCINNREYERCRKIRVKKKEIFSVKKIEINKTCPQRTILHLEDSYGNMHLAYKQYFKIV